MSDDKTLKHNGVEIPLVTKDRTRRSGKDLQAMAEEMGVHPFEMLLHAIAGNYKAFGYDEPITRKVTAQGVVTVEVLPVDLRIAAAKEAAQYLHPKKKAIEVSGNEDNPLNIAFTGDPLDLVRSIRSSKS